ncbi:MAG: hypothetical protein IBJ13_16450 [Sphingopyxis sp.]|nr:hypothetical protein [Sphingopyxis sp.]
MKRAEATAVVTATLIAIAVALGIAMPGDVDPSVIAPSSDVGCANSGRDSGGGIQFILTCPQSSLSPDGQWRLVQTPAIGSEESYDVLIERTGSSRRFSIPGINDGMPFVLYWSPRRDWFLINHYAGSGLERPRVFEMTSSGVVEHRRHLKAGLTKAHTISPCLPVEKMEATGSGLKWSRDGRRLAWVFTTRPDMCVFYGGMSGPIPPAKQWKPFMMISDVRTGEIAEDSIRLLSGDGKLDVPTDGPYRDF